MLLISERHAVRRGAAAVTSDRCRRRRLDSHSGCARVSINAAIYETLIGTCFDDNADGTLHSRHGEVLRMLTTARPLLCVSDLMHSLRCVRAVTIHALYFFPRSLN